jgi:RimJ/RimL family protein N-acetyltransferase
MTGSVVAIYVAAAGRGPMKPLPQASLESGRGIRGDRYYARTGTFSKSATRPDQEVTLIESEEIDAFSRSAGLALDYGAPRRNVVTRGVRLNDLVGARFEVGGALLEGIRLCEPCAHLAGLVAQQVLPGLVHRAGLRARILRSGIVAPGDSVAVASVAGAGGGASSDSGCASTSSSSSNTSSTALQTENLTLVLQTPEQVLARISGLEPEIRKEVSADWLEQLHAASESDPWVHGFAMVRRGSGTVVGYCGFKGAPLDGMVEIAYGVNDDERGKGYATEAATALVAFALGARGVDVVRAHTLPESHASQRILAKCGFERVGDAIDPDDGLVWRFEKRRA